MFQRSCFILMALATASCATTATQPPRPAPVRTQPAQFVALLTEGVRIVAEDGSFEIKSGDNAPPPFVCSGPDLDPAAQLGNYELYLAQGARKVKVHTPWLSQPLYGVLALLPVHVTADPIARRAYRIQVSETRVQEATGARLSYLYQPYGSASSSENAAMERAVFEALAADPVFQTQMAQMPAPGQRASWILWLSDAPL